MVKGVVFLVMVVGVVMEVVKMVQSADGCPLPGGEWPEKRNAGVSFAPTQEVCAGLPALHQNYMLYFPPALLAQHC